MPTSESDPTAAVEAARKLQASLDNSSLNIAKSRADFDDRTAPGEDSILNLPLTFSESSRLVDPATVSLDVTAQLVCFLSVSRCIRA